MWIIQDPETYGFVQGFHRFSQSQFDMSHMFFVNRFDNQLKWLCGSSRIWKPMVCVTFLIGFKNMIFTVNFRFLITFWWCSQMPLWTIQDGPQSQLTAFSKRYQEYGFCIQFQILDNAFLNALIMQSNASGDHSGSRNLWFAQRFGRFNNLIFAFNFRFLITFW